MKDLQYLSILLSFFLTGNLSAQQGLKAEYYNGTNFEEKVFERIDANIDFFWNNEPPVPGLTPHVCSVRWTGELEAPETGTYTFSARVDDGIRVWVGREKVIDAWGLHDEGHFAKDIELEKGRRYKLEVEYFNALIEAEVRLLWKLPSDQSYFGSLFESDPKVIPDIHFFHTPDPVTSAQAEFFEPTEPDPPAQPRPAPQPEKKKPRKKDPPPAPEEQAVHVDTLEKYIPKNVMFSRAESEILSPSFKELDNLAGFLRRNSQYKLKIEGHTDVPGDPAKNWQLSERRAYAVAAYLVKAGIGAERVEAKGYGSSRPVIPSDGKVYHPENRRVEFIFHPLSR